LLDSLRVAVVHNTNPYAVLGDRIRVEAMIKMLLENGYETLDVRIPSKRAVRDLLYAVTGSEKTRLLKTFLSRKGITDGMSLVASTSGTTLSGMTRLLARLNPDVVLIELTSTKIGWAASIAARNLSLKCILDAHGLGFAEARGRGKKNWLQVLNIEKETFQNCSHIIAVSYPMKECLKNEFGICDEKISVAPNGSQPHRPTAKFEMPLKVIFSGIFAYWEKVWDVLDIAQNANRKMFKFFLAGSGPLRNELLSKIRKEKIPITYLGQIGRDRIYEVLSKMQVGLVPSTRDLTRQVASPIKTFDYMACGLPVLTSKIGDWGKMISEEHCGFALENDTVEEYLKALNVLVAKDAWQEMSGNGIEAIEKRYSWNSCLRPVIDSIEMLK
jgi:glycosyltransferase involved in cell wall biosynthesis